MATWFDALGSGKVEYHPDRPILHFATPPAEVEHALRAAQLRRTGFETTKEMPG